MQMQKSWSDAVREARAAREVERRRTPAGYKTEVPIGFVRMGGNIPGYIELNPLYKSYGGHYNGGSQLGDWLADLSQAVTTAASTYSQIKSADMLAAAGISPVGYSPYGSPLYQSTPPGVTPQYGSSVPSGMVLPAGVTPSYQYPIGFVQQGGYNPSYQVTNPTLANQAGMFGGNLPLIALGIGAVALIAVMAAK